MENIYKLISKEFIYNGGHLKVNKTLIKKLGIDAAVLYSELLSLQTDAVNNLDYELIDNKPFFVVTVEKIAENFDLSPHKQRLILLKLQENNLISVYYNAKTNIRMINVNDDIYNIYSVLRQTDNYKYYENMYNGIDYLVQYIVKNWELAQKEEPDWIKSNIEAYMIKRFSKKPNPKLKQKVFHMLIDENLKNEFVNHNDFCRK